MVETMLIITFVTILMFATVQLCTVVVNDLIANEAASAINRAVTVTSARSKGNVGLKAALYVFARSAAVQNLLFVPYDIRTDRRLIVEGANGESSNIYAYITYVKYASSIIFAAYLNPKDSYTVGNIHLLKNTARAQTVHPPDEEYYYKSYPGAPEY